MGLFKDSFSTLFSIRAFIAAGSSFSQVVDHIKAIDRTCIYTYGGRSKRTCHQYDAIGIPSESEDPPR